jgi:hypothetical protein
MFSDGSADGNNIGFEILRGSNNRETDGDASNNPGLSDPAKQVGLDSSTGNGSGAVDANTDCGTNLWFFNKSAPPHNAALQPLVGDLQPHRPPEGITHIE